MSTSPLPIHLANDHGTCESAAKKAAEFESLARLVEDLIPRFKKKRERQFYDEVVRSYRAAAQEILESLVRRRGQEISEDAFMRAIIPVIVVRTIRLLGSNANTAFSQAAKFDSITRRS